MHVLNPLYPIEAARGNQNTGKCCYLLCFSFRKPVNQESLADVMVANNSQGILLCPNYTVSKQAELKSKSMYALVSTRSFTSCHTCFSF